MNPMNDAWVLLKASRQMKLYNYIENYPGKKPVTAYRGAPFFTSAPMDAKQWYQKDTPIDLDKKGTWWVEGGAEPHATASFFARMPMMADSLDNKHAVVLGHRGALENTGEVQRRKKEWNPVNEATMNEALVSHNKPIDWENIVFSQPSDSVTDSMNENKHEEWLRRNQS